MSNQSLSSLSRYYESFQPDQDVSDNNGVNFTDNSHEESISNTSLQSDNYEIIQFSTYADFQASSSNSSRESSPSRFLTSTSSQDESVEFQSLNDQSQNLSIEGGLRYLDQVKMEFWYQPEKYQHFLNTMNDYNIELPLLIKRVTKLFKGKPELISGFIGFLPHDSELAVHLNKIVIKSRG